MQPLAPMELKTRVVDAGLSTHPSPVMAIVEGYTALNDKESLTEAEDKLLYECALAVAVHGFAEQGPAAMAVVAARVAEKGVEHYRPTPPPEPAPDDSAE